MPDTLTLDDFTFDKTVVDQEQIAQFKSEDEFTFLAVELFKEISVITVILGSSYALDENNKPRPWTRNEAILGGLFIRLAKLQSGLLDAVCQKRLEIANILFRCLAETSINLKYLMQSHSDGLYDEYVEYSLREEKRLLNLIDRNVTSRGYELPIENRMRQSIARAFANSGMTPDRVNENKRGSWGQGIYKRAESVGMADGYNLFFGLPSHVVHGNWQDLLQYHLEPAGAGFFPNVEWSVPRPQFVLAAAHLTADVCHDYLPIILPECEERNKLQQLIDDCVERLVIVDEAHERFIQTS